MRKIPRTSTLVERANRAAAEIESLTKDIDYHSRSASQLRRQREWAKQRLARAKAAILREHQK